MNILARVLRSSPGESDIIRHIIGFNKVRIYNVPPHKQSPEISIPALQVLRFQIPPSLSLYLRVPAPSWSRRQDGEREKERDKGYSPATS